MKKPILVILAAGMGSRFGGLKQMTPVDDFGNSILHFSLFDAYRAGFGKVVFIIKKAIEEDFRKITAGVEQYMEVAFVNQELDKLPEGFAVPEGRVKPWGTGHAVLCAKDELDAPFAVVNADDFYGRGAFETIVGFLTEEHADNEFAMVGFRLRNALTENGTVARGICSTENGLLTGVREQLNISKNGNDAKYTDDGGETFTEISGDTIVSMNFWGYRRSFVEALEEWFPRFQREAVPANPLKAEFFLPTVTDELLKSGKATVRVLDTDEAWYGVTYREDLPSVQAAIAAMREAGKYPEILFPTK